MFDAVCAEECADRLEAIGSNEQDRLPEIPYALELDESRIPIRLPVDGDCVAENEAANPRTLPEVTAVHIPRDDVSGHPRSPLPAGSSHGFSTWHFTQLSKKTYDTSMLHGKGSVKLKIGHDEDESAMREVPADLGLAHVIDPREPDPLELHDV